jgi:hypothetical protein
MGGTYRCLPSIGASRFEKQYRIVFELTTEVAEIYEHAFHLYANNGDDRSELLLRDNYTIDQESVIRYAFLNAAYSNRAEPADIPKTTKRKFVLVERKFFLLAALNLLPSLWRNH